MEYLKRRILLVVLASVWHQNVTALSLQPSRRTVLGRFVSTSVSVCSGVSSIPRSASAAESSSEIFAKIREEVEGRGSGGMRKLESLLDAQDKKGIVSFTREYAGFLRNGLVAKARKSIAEENKDTAKSLYDAILEDLIAVNKLVRANDQDEARRYYGILKSDINKFLELEPLSS